MGKGEYARYLIYPAAPEMARLLRWAPRRSNNSGHARRGRKTGNDQMYRCYPGRALWSGATARVSVRGRKKVRLSRKLSVLKSSPSGAACGTAHGVPGGMKMANLFTGRCVVTCDHRPLAGSELPLALQRCSALFPAAAKKSVV